MTLKIGVSNLPGKKRGNLSTDEMKFINSNLKKMSLQDIAKAMNRNVGPIKRYVRDKEILRVKRDASNLCLHIAN